MNDDARRLVRALDALVRNQAESRVAGKRAPPASEREDSRNIEREWARLQECCAAFEEVDALLKRLQTGPQAAAVANRITNLLKEHLSMDLSEDWDLDPELPLPRPPATGPGPGGTPLPEWNAWLEEYREAIRLNHERAKATRRDREHRWAEYRTRQDSLLAEALATVRTLVD